MSLKEDLQKSTKKSDAQPNDKVDIKEETKMEILETPTNTSTSSSTTSSSTSSSSSSSTTTLKGEEPKTITFEKLKEEIKRMCKEDRILKRLSLSFVDEPNILFLYQGVHSNILARIRNSGNHIVQRAIIQKRLEKLLDLEIVEPKE